MGKNKAFFILLVMVLFIVEVNGDELINKVVAFVDNEAITLADLKEKYEKTLKVVPDTTLRQVAETMVNRLLLKQEGVRLKIVGDSDDEIINKYIDMSIRADIVVNYEEVEAFFNKNRANFADIELDSVREDIEKLLIEEEVNKRLQAKVEELKKRTYVEIHKLDAP
ncbi:MAG: hypothetical protein L3V56_07190 [Candidatus Magnetoovum sp. WYHC-5]|nr:hypothetical protein [Candidatus Magnetoovum sp. WYHC-5]